MDARRREVLKFAALATLAGPTTVVFAASSSSEANTAEARQASAGRAHRALAARYTAEANTAEGNPAMQTRALMTLLLTTAPTQDIGVGPHGTRVTFPIMGGSFEGERLRGKVLPGGDDWTIKRADGVMELDLRITLETDDGALIHMTFEGIRDDGAPGAPYFHTLPRFETAAARYAFLNRLLAVGTGEIRANGPVHVIEEIL